MSKWIDYDAIDYRNDKLHDKTDEFLNGVVYMAQRIEDAPCINIVHCKECKWYDDGQNESDSWSYCTRHFECYISVSANDFCSYGERNSE